MFEASAYDTLDISNLPSLKYVSARKIATSGPSIRESSSKVKIFKYF